MTFKHFQDGEPAMEWSPVEEDMRNAPAVFYTKKVGKKMTWVEDGALSLLFKVTGHLSRSFKMLKLSMFKEKTYFGKFVNCDLQSHGNIGHWKLIEMKMFCPTEDICTHTIKPYISIKIIWQVMTCQTQSEQLSP